MPYCGTCTFDILDGQDFLTIPATEGFAVDRHGVPYRYSYPEAYFHNGRSRSMCDYLYSLSLEGEDA